MEGDGWCECLGECSLVNGSLWFNCEVPGCRREGREGDGMICRRKGREGEGVILCVCV